MLTCFFFFFFCEAKPRTDHINLQDYHGPTWFHTPKPQPTATISYYIATAWCPSAAMRLWPLARLTIMPLGRPPRLAPKHCITAMGWADQTSSVNCRCEPRLEKTGPCLASCNLSSATSTERCRILNIYCRMFGYGWRLWVGIEPSTNCEAPFLSVGSFRCQV